MIHYVNDILIFEGEEFAFSSKEQAATACELFSASAKAEGRNSFFIIYTHRECDIAPDAA